jgi:hypothetical protein
MEPVPEILKFFKYDHLPPKLQEISKPFCLLAFAIVGDERGMPAGTSIQFPLPSNAERAVALRKLLEAKDAAVRATL